MHVSQQILNVLRAERLAESGHFVASVIHNIHDPLVIGRKPAERKILVLKNSLEPRTFLAPRGIGFVATVAILIINLPSRGLLRRQTKFCVRFAPLNVTAREREDERQYNQTSCHRLKSKSATLSANPSPPPNRVYQPHEFSRSAQLSKRRSFTTPQFTIIDEAHVGGGQASL